MKKRKKLDVAAPAIGAAVPSHSPQSEANSYFTLANYCDCTRGIRDDNCSSIIIAMRRSS
jgi:hypothetical protein